MGLGPGALQRQTEDAISNNEITVRGPYRSPRARGKWFVVTGIHNNQEVVVATRNASQPSVGLVFANYCEATTWLRANGYELVAK